MNETRRIRDTWEYEMSVFFGFIVIGIGILFYALPGIIAFRRLHKNRMSITILNVLTGWTALGWIIAIVWAFTDNTESQAN